MRHLRSGRILSRRRGHRKAMLANLAASLVKSGRVKTTDIKAKEVRPFIERLITFAKRGDLHARRIVLARLKDAIAVKKLFDEIGPQFANRTGGYTRILKLGFRRGDNSPVSFIEFVSDDESKKTTKKRKTVKTSKSKEKVKSAKAPEKVSETEKEEHKAKEKKAKSAPVEQAEMEEQSSPSDTGKDAAPEESPKPESGEEK